MYIYMCIHVHIHIYIHNIYIYVYISWFSLHTIYNNYLYIDHLPKYKSYKKLSIKTEKNIKAKTISHLKQNIGENVRDIKLCKCLLNKTEKSQTTEQ